MTVRETRHNENEIATGISPLIYLRRLSDLMSEEDDKKLRFHADPLDLVFVSG